MLQAGIAGTSLASSQYHASRTPEKPAGAKPHLELCEVAQDDNLSVLLNCSQGGLVCHVSGRRAGLLLHPADDAITACNIAAMGVAGMSQAPPECMNVVKR